MPYVMVRPEKNLTGNDRYEGFCIDLLKAIAGTRLFANGCYIHITNVARQ